MASPRQVLEEVLGAPKSKVLDYLIQCAQWPDRESVTAQELAKATGLHRAKVFQYLSELRDQALVISSGKRPTKYRVCDTILLPNQLVLAKSDKVASRKKKLDDELDLFKKKIEETDILSRPEARSGTAIVCRPEARSAQHLTNREEVYAALNESLKLVPKGERVLCQTPSLTHWALSAEDVSKIAYQEKFLETFRSRLKKNEISAAIYLCPSEASVKRLMSSRGAVFRVDSLCENLRTVRNLVVLASERVLPGSMEIMIFGHKRVIYGLGDEHGILDQGFMIEGSAAASSAEEMFNRIFEETKQSCMSRYLDELRVAERARLPEATKMLLKLVASAERGHATRIDLGRWRTAKDLLLTNLTEEIVFGCLKNHTVDSLRAVTS